MFVTSKHLYKSIIIIDHLLMTFSSMETSTKVHVVCILSRLLLDNSITHCCEMVLAIGQVISAIVDELAIRDFDESVSC